MPPASDTARLQLRRVCAADVDALHVIASDPRVWTHFPSLRPTAIEQTAALVERWQDSWNRYGLGMWTVLLAGRVIGYGGCSVNHDLVWNLGYRLDADEHGQGYATEIARQAVRTAQQVASERPVTAYLVEHNRASARVAEKVGLELVHRGPDAGNPDPTVQRLVYADRALTAQTLAAILEA